LNLSNLIPFVLNIRKRFMDNQTEFVHFCSHTPLKTGFLSNWYHSVFYLDGVKFSSGEQAMMYKKAKLMGDEDIAAHVMITDDPKKIKALGRQVKNWDERLWNAHKIDIMTAILIAKFSQNKDILQKLLATKDATLVEAAHYDKIWGNGLRETDANARNPAAWPGQNLLGKCLMDVRTQLNVAN
jgi:ribA/ribD-fused uncharacterized protein